MRAFVFTDKALTKHAGQFVWLSIDTEKPQNAAFIHKYPIRAWPSFYVIDPASEKITLRWVGGATVAELDKLFNEASTSGPKKGVVASAALKRADALYAEAKYADSIAPYREAIQTLPKTSPSYVRAVEALLFGLSVSDQPAECVTVARARSRRKRLRVRARRAGRPRRSEAPSRRRRPLGPVQLALRSAPGREGR